MHWHYVNWIDSWVLINIQFYQYKCKAFFVWNEYGPIQSTTYESFGLFFLSHFAVPRSEPAIAHRRTTYIYIYTELKSFYLASI